MANPAETTDSGASVRVGVAGDPSREKIDRRLAVAPMMDWTDRHCRFFLRGFAPDVLLYTEMITASAILRGNRARLLAFHPQEHPIALQLGGSDAHELAAAARLGEEAGYDEINLNCGCPSDRVRSGTFGACLMREPERVAECVAAMRAAVQAPVTVKMRIGVVEGRGASIAAVCARFDDDDRAALLRFARAVIGAGSDVLIVHARKAVLGGLSPKANREVPPLRYDIVRELKEALPGVRLILNGGLRQRDEILEALGWCDGVMLGREAYHRPYLLAELSAALRGSAQLPSHSAILDRMSAYAAEQVRGGEQLASITRHMLGLCSGEPGAREYRRLLSEGARSARGAPERLLQQAAALLSAQPSRVRDAHSG